MESKKEEVQAKGIHNIFNKIIAENFTNLETETPIQVQEFSRTSNTYDQNTTSPSTENKERILKVERQEKNNL
jgi:hypothetical protein